MSTIHHVTLTPPRKRAVSGADLRPYSFPATPKSLPESQSTPDADRVPELVWDDSPGLTESLPSTPSSGARSSQTRSTDREVPITPTRIFKEPRRSNRIAAREALKPLLFPLFLYPALPASQERDVSMASFINGNIGARNFNFSKQWRRMHMETRGNSTVGAPAPQLPYTLPKERNLVPQRVKKENFFIDQTSNRELGTVADIPSISVKVASGPGVRQITIKSESDSESKVNRQRSTARYDWTQLEMATATARRFNRILPFNAIERLMEEPGICVASLVTRPNQRCAKPTKSCTDAKVWLVDYLSNFVAPRDLIAAESYLRELVNVATCTASRHRSISTVQLERLLSRFDEDRCLDTQVSERKHAFTSRDEEAIPYWLEALTKLPDTRTTASRHSVQQTYTSSKGLSTITTSVQSSSTSVFKEMPQITESNQKTVQDFRNVKVTSNIKTTHTIETSQTSKSYDSADTPQTCTTNKSDEVTQTIDTLRTEKTAQTKEISHSVEKTQSIKSTQTTKKTDAPFETVVPLETTTKITTTRTATTHSTFDPTQRITISFMTTSNVKLATNGKLRKATMSKETKIWTPKQKFEWYRPVGSLRCSAQEWIRKCLVRPLTQREKGKDHRGIKYICTGWSDTSAWSRSARPQEHRPKSG